MEIKENDNTGCALTIFAMFVAGLLMLASYSEKETSLETKDKIIPEYKLTTDGKTIDTIWIYKNK